MSKKVQTRYEVYKEEPTKTVLRIRIVGLSSIPNTAVENVRQALKQTGVLHVDFWYHSYTKEGAVCRLILEPGQSLEDKSVKEFIELAKFF